MAVICERGHRRRGASPGDRCEMEMRKKAGGKERCGLPFIEDPTPDRCSCRRGIRIDGWCSACGRTAFGSATQLAGDLAREMAPTRRLYAHNLTAVLDGLYGPVSRRNAKAAPDTAEPERGYTNRRSEGTDSAPNRDRAAYMRRYRRTKTTATV